MQQSSATPSLHLDYWGLRKIVACSQSSSQCLLVPTVFGTVSSLHPTSFLMIFILVYIGSDGTYRKFCKSGVFVLKMFSRDPRVQLASLLPLLTLECSEANRCDRSHTVPYTRPFYAP